jgi:hypothetical protein
LEFERQKGGKLCLSVVVIKYPLASTVVLSTYLLRRFFLLGSSVNDDDDDDHTTTFSMYFFFFLSSKSWVVDTRGAQRATPAGGGTTPCWEESSHGDVPTPGLEHEKR